jgi:antitoxin ParD1/3/4
MVRQKVSSDLYTSASEVIREALCLTEEQDRLRAVMLEQLRRDIQDGLKSGPAMPWNAEKTKQAGHNRRSVRSSLGRK